MQLLNFAVLFRSMLSRIDFSQYLQDARAVVYSFVAASILLAVMIVFQLGTLFSTLYAFIAEPEYVLQRTEVSKISAEKANKKSSRIIDIAQWHLFGQLLPTQLSVRQAPKTQLALTLTGVVIHGAATNDSQAIIAFADGTEKSYHLGEEIPEVGKLYQISPLGVLLLHNGQLESLALNGEEETSSKTQH